MKRKVGIRHEDKYLMERRVAVIPAHVARLTREQGLEFIVEESPKRVFTHEEYRNAGASIVTDLGPASFILGVICTRAP